MSSGVKVMILIAILLASHLSAFEWGKAVQRSDELERIAELRDADSKAVIVIRREEKSEEIRREEIRRTINAVQDSTGVLDSKLPSDFVDQLRNAYERTTGPGVNSSVR